MEYYSTTKKEWNNAISSNMDGPRDYQTKWSESEREKQTSYVAYMWNLKYGTNKPICETDSQTWRKELWLPRDCEFGVVDAN